MSVPTHVWVSKYALIDGKVTLCEVAPGASQWLILVGMTGAYHLGSDCHLTRVDALLKAGKMKAEKIASHQKSIDRLRKLTFADDAS